MVQGKDVGVILAELSAKYKVRVVHLRGDES